MYLVEDLVVIVLIIWAPSLKQKTPRTNRGSVFAS
jgi:hypothetical protein